jgi:hypothetical protein
MKKLMAVAAFAVSLAGPLAFATDSSSPTQQTGLAASISPAYIQPGGQVTVTSIQPCPLQQQGTPTQLYWSLGPGALAGTVATGVDGTWTVRFAAPITPGVSPFIAYCAYQGRTTAMYNQLNFTIVARRPPVVTG